MIKNLETHFGIKAHVVIDQATTVVVADVADIRALGPEAESKMCTFVSGFVAGSRLAELILK